MGLPLEGTRILHLASAGPAQYCTMILSDLGCDVIIIEEPAVGGRRAEIAKANDAPSERTVAFDMFRRNKRSITLNLKSEAARVAFYKLVEISDVVVEGFRPGVANRLGVNYDSLKKVNPKIIYCAITGYGQTGPYRDLAGHDINYISIAGVLSLIGQQGGPPAIPSNLVADYGGGAMHAVMGILVALLVRDRTGVGQYIDVSLTDTSISLMAHSTPWYFESGTIPSPGSTVFAGALPHYSIYETKDGKYISVGALEPWLYATLCRALGREDLIEHRTNTAKHEEIFALFRETFRTRTRDEWFEYLRQFDACVTPVHTFDEVFQDPHVLERGMVAELVHPAFGTVKQIGIAVKFSETPGAIRSLGPVAGQHTDAILRQIDYTEAAIQTLRDQGAI